MDLAFLPLRSWAAMRNNPKWSRGRVGQTAARDFKALLWDVVKGKALLRQKPRPPGRGIAPLSSCHPNPHPREIWAEAGRLLRKGRLLGEDGPDRFGRDLSSLPSKTNLTKETVLSFLLTCSLVLASQRRAREAPKSKIGQITHPLCQMAAEGGLCLEIRWWWWIFPPIG